MMTNENNFPAGNNTFYTGVGSMDTPPAFLKYLSEQAKILKENGYICRTGDARGADAVFREAASDKHIVFDSSLPQPDKVMALAKGVYSGNWDSLSPVKRRHYVAGVYQVFGRLQKSRPKFVLYYSKPNDDYKTYRHPWNNVRGGTEIAVRIAIKYNIQVFNLYNQSEFWEGFCKHNGIAHPCFETEGWGTSHKQNSIAHPCFETESDVASVVETAVPVEPEGETLEVSPSKEIPKWWSIPYSGCENFSGDWMDLWKDLL